MRNGSVEEFSSHKLNNFNPETPDEKQSLFCFIGCLGSKIGLLFIFNLKANRLDSRPLFLRLAMKIEYRITVPARVKREEGCKSPADPPL